ncbi:hypothetical protein PR202_gb09412 [Eleusine coracana subsp. coracana]|uniref:Uncharacterized protein n=1 Tax=Eleusine coracana subsp. coracana TaxID=191504 RepID=A0AAV5EGX1_ELECO|nr:hypothetical protein PR202_gb09412 [Eleusine coracana subsp. coracana]
MRLLRHLRLAQLHIYDYRHFTSHCRQQNQSGAAEAWWAHNPQVPGSKPGSDNFLFFSLLSLCV